MFLAQSKLQLVCAICLISQTHKISCIVVEWRNSSFCSTPYMQTITLMRDEKQTPCPLTKFYSPELNVCVATMHTEILLTIVCLFLLEGNVDPEDKPLVVQACLQRLAIEPVGGIHPLHPVVVEHDGALVLVLLVPAQDGLGKLVPRVVVLDGRVDGWHLGRVNEDRSSGPRDDIGGARDGHMGRRPGDEVVGNARELGVRGHVSIGGSRVEPVPGLEEDGLLRVEGGLGDDLDVRLGVLAEVISEDGSGGQEQAAEHAQQCMCGLHLLFCCL